MHISKTGGTTLNNILMKNYRFRIDSYGHNFFPRYYPDEFVWTVQPPTSDDTRRPVYFTGHINVDNDVFRYMPVRYVAITMLRDPVRRLVSHYRYHATLPGDWLAAAIKQDGLGIVDYFRRFRADIPLQYEVFAPRPGADEGERVAQALRTLEAKFSLIGLQEQYVAFVVLMKELLGMPDVFYAPLNKTPSSAPDPDPRQLDELRGLLEHDIAFYEGAKTIYERRVAALGSGLGERVKAFGSAQQQYFDLVSGTEGAGHAWRRYYAGLTKG